MPEMKACFGRELAMRFSPGTAPIGVDINESRRECYACPDLDHCAVVLGLVLQLRSRGMERSSS